MEFCVNFCGECSPLPAVHHRKPFVIESLLFFIRRSSLKIVIFVGKIAKMTQIRKQITPPYYLFIRVELSE